MLKIFVFSEENIYIYTLKNPATIAQLLKEIMNCKTEKELQALKRRWKPKPKRATKIEVQELGRP